MSKNDISKITDNEELCVVCFNNVNLYSIGACDHPVCYECSTRMRVLCNQMECPICRGEMPQVIFTREKKPFKELRPNPALYDTKYGLQFSSRSIEDIYYNLLQHVCSKCNKICNTFLQLRDHMRKEHELFYCDLCVDNLKIFAFERRCYTRAELGVHRRKGDDNNRSHRGHPLCQFCDQRYMDNDDLFRHLRREHLYCHFCDADGKHEYYPSYDELRVHFLKDHYLCEEGDCKNEQFTSVFRSDIDLKAHVALMHSKHLSRGATKQARTLEVVFSFKPRPHEHRQNNHHRNHQRFIPTRVEEEANGTDEPGGSSRPPRLPTDSDFPTLGNSADSASMARTSVQFTSKLSKPKFNNNEFPSLGSSSAPGGAPRSSITVANSASAPPRNITITKTSAGGSRKANAPLSAHGYGNKLVMNAQNFPTLKPETSTATSTVKLSVGPARAVTQPSNLSIHVNHNGSAMSSSIKVRPKSFNTDAFPVLGGTSNETTPDAKQWVMTQVKKHQVPKVSKVAKAPVLSPSSLDEFPALGRKPENNSTNVTHPMHDPKHVDVGNAINNNYDCANPNIKSVPVKKEQKNAVSNGKQKQMKNDFDVRTTTELKTTKNHKNKKKSKSDNPTQSLAKEENKPNTTNGINGPASRPSSEHSDQTNLPRNVEKKTSTLKIGNLEQPDEQTVAMPPGFTVKPPPGFGFESRLNSHNDLTFTSSSGQSYSILPVNSTYVFIQPPNFQHRNSNLIRTFFSILKTQECLDEFKSFSELFRQGLYPAIKYYEYCENVIGSMFDVVFPEVVLLLPNIEKQQELYQIHKLKTKSTDLEQCPTCMQVICRQERMYHMKHHSAKEANGVGCSG